MVIDRLDAHLIEIRDLIVDITRCVLDHAVDQELQAAHRIHHVLHTCNPVVSLDISNLSALGIHPFNTLTDVERIGQAIVGHLITLSQCRLLNILHIILHQSVIRIDDRLVVHCLACSENIPCRWIRIIEIVAVRILQLISVVRQIFLHPLLIGSCTF